MHRILPALTLALVAGLFAAGLSGARAQTPSDAPVLLRADWLTHDRTSQIVTAEGHVELAQSGRILLADRVTYDQLHDRVIASGSVSILEPSGEVMFADAIELTDEMKNGVVTNIRLLMTDHSRLAANGARRSDGNRTEMRKAVYSPCSLCVDDPESAPLWQLKAIRVEHDQEDHMIEYSDVFMEIYGVPVMYLPYFAHPDPTVRRKSGFIAPSYGSSSTLGLNVTTPYFWNIQPHRDFTFSPIFTSKEGVVLAGEYREHTGNGIYRLGGSWTHVDRRGDDGERIGGEETRGHIEGDGRFALSPAWMWGFDLSRATDDTYRSRYRFGSEDTLTTDFWLHGQDGRRFASLAGYWFQGLEEDDDPGEFPIILPTFDYEFISDPSSEGNWWSVNANALVLARSEGTDSRRLSITGGWHTRFIGASGDVYNFSARLRGDLYWVNDVANPADPNTTALNGVTGRLIPEVTLGWRYPLIAQHESIRQVIEPILTAIVSPYGGNLDKIPNEDSVDFEFDDTNLFSSNRFTGLDRVEGGPRVNYGVRWGLYGESGGQTTALLGQSARLKDDSTFGIGTGLESNFSDYVGRIAVIPADYLDISYRFRLDRKSLTAQRNEVNASIGPSYLNTSITYLQLDTEISADTESEFANREEISFVGNLDLTESWTLSLDHRRDLTGDGGSLNSGSTLTYEDECLLFRLRANRRFTEDRDVEPETTVLFTIQFKHLG